MLWQLSHLWLPQQPSSILPGNASWRASQAARGAQATVGPELEGGMVKAGWWTHCRDPADQGLQWPYLPPRFPLPSHLYIEEVDIRFQARDAERKPWDCFQ